MNYFRYPFLVFALSFVVLWLSARIGVSFRKRRRIWKKTSVKISALSWPLL